jgi:anti-repressor protein
MDELIRIEERDGIRTVDAKELHDGLKVQDRFDQWIARRIEKYGFIEGADFCTVLCESTGGRPSTRYYVSTDMAKELCMVENNEEGRKYRRYFIEMEKKASESFALPKTYAEALQLAADQAKEIEQKNTALAIAAPKIAFFDSVTNSKDAIDMKDAAKVLNIGIGRNTLFQKLRDLKILMDNNTPYQTFIDRGYFRVIESRWTTPQGEVKISLKTVVYQRGLDFILKELRK